jgi:medium-chain acyl-[acyl-carrier-protein] hydrolase
MIQHFEKDITVSQYECDFLNRMKPSSILRQVEQVSMDNCTAIGVDAALYERTHTAFLLAKLVLVLNRDITVGEQIHLDTTAALPVRAVYNRYTSLTVSGEEAAGVDTRWVLVDTQTKRILRKPPEEFQLPFVDRTEKSFDMSIRKGTELETLGMVKAEYSRTDINGHLNNAEYADIIFNYLPAELLREQALKKMVIYYHNELPFGEEMRLLRGTNEDGQFYFQGIRERDGKPCFEAEAIFENGC